MTPISVADFAAAAREHLPPDLYAFIAGGALDEQTLRSNESAYSQIQLRYRVLQGIKQVDLTVELMQQRLAMPVIAAPTGSQALVRPEGELAVRRATSDAGSLMTVATTATYSMAAIKAAAVGPLWFQLYLFKDEGLNREMVDRAETLGYDAIVLTVDAPVFGLRERDARTGFQLPAGLTYENLPTGVGDKSEDVAAFMNANYKQAISWSDVDWLRQQTRLPILLKGIAHPADAELGLEHGVDGIWVSNHGGRQLDSAPATIELLPAIARRLAGQLPIILDGGIRRGTDILKAVALGATAVAIGRPILWGLAVAGQAGVAQILTRLRDELANGMALCGCDSLKALHPDLVISAGGTHD